MGKRSQNQPYRDDPDAVSLHTTPEDYLDAASSSNDNLPSYGESENVASTERDNATRAGRVANFNDDYSVIQLGGANGWRHKSGNKKGSSREVQARMDPRLSDPGELFQYLDGYLQWMLPNPAICVEGWHWKTVHRKDKKEKERVTDFDITLSLMQYIGNTGDVNGEWRQPRVVTNGEKTYRGSWRKTRAPGARQDLEIGGEVERDLRAWVEDYCASPASLKVFRMSRNVIGLDEEYIKNALKQVITQTNYRGHVDVQIVMENRAVDVYSDHWVNAWRTGWQRWIFYLTFLWIFTWPILFFMTKRWAVFTVDFPFSKAWPERGPNARRFATISEEEWFRKHEKMIKRLVLQRFQGGTDGLSLDDAMEDARDHSSERGSMGSTGNPNVDSAVNLIQAGVGGWNSIQRAMGRDVDGWGHDC